MQVTPEAKNAPSLPTGKVCHSQVAEIVEAVEADIFYHVRRALRHRVEPQTAGDASIICVDADRGVVLRGGHYLRYRVIQQSLEQAGDVCRMVVCVPTRKHGLRGDVHQDDRATNNRRSIQTVSGVHVKDVLVREAEEALVVEDGHVLAERAPLH